MYQDAINHQPYHVHRISDNLISDNYSKLALIDVDSSREKIAGIRTVVYGRLTFKDICIKLGQLKFKGVA